MPYQSPDDQAREFAAAFRGFLDWIHSVGAREENEVSALVREFLGPDGMNHSVVSREMPPFEHVNLQAAVDAWSAGMERTVQVHGIAVPPHHGDLSLSNWSRVRRCHHCGWDRLRWPTCRTGRGRPLGACVWHCCWSPTGAAAMS